MDFDDIDPFVVALEGQAAYETAYPDCNWLHGDINGDGVVDFDDLDVFLGLVSSGNAAVWVAYTWDAENRLVGVAPGGTPKSGDVKLAFVYDYMGRSVEKKVWTHNGSSWGDPTEHRKFVWNGWLLLMELDGLNDDAVLRKRTWGLDLAGLMGGASSVGPASGRSMLEGAGGIGGLLAVHDANGTTTGENPEADDEAYVYFYDANGNVGQVCDLSHTPSDPAGAIVARYEYDPYGNVTSQSGDYAAANPFRFSTKYFDDETGLGYWGYRYYDPKLGRWVNRDPIGELGGSNIYGYTRNYSTASIDAFGLDFWARCRSGCRRLVEGVVIICLCGPYDAVTVVLECKAIAEREAAKHTGDDDTQNAIRHCVLSACLHSKLSTDDANNVLDTHEAVWGVGTCDSAADSHNNNVGEAIGGSTTDIQDIIKKCNEAWANGDLITESQAHDMGLCDCAGGGPCRGGSSAGGSGSGSDDAQGSSGGTSGPSEGDSGRSVPGSDNQSCNGGTSGVNETIGSGSGRVAGS